jgi:hypothetical protein
MIYTAKNLCDLTLLNNMRHEDIYKINVILV